MRMREPSHGARSRLAGCLLAILLIHSYPPRGPAAESTPVTPAPIAADSTVAGSAAVADSTATPWYESRRFWIIAGIATVAVVAVTLALTGDEETPPERLPEFPPPP